MVIHGMNGWFLAISRGVLRTMRCQQDQQCNVIVGDIVVNGIIVLAYERHRKSTTLTFLFKKKDPKIAYTTTKLI